jgi:hypothetical protein
MIAPSIAYLKTKLTRQRILTIAVFVGAVAFLGSGLSYFEPELNEAQDIAIAPETFVHWNLPVDQSPVYYLVLNFWERLNDTSLAFLRVPSVIFGALGAVFAFWLVQAETGVVGGLLAALLLTLNPMAVYYARTARVYSLLIALSAACMWYAYAYLTGGRRYRDFVAFLICAVLGIYSHLFFLLMAGSLALLLIADFVKNRRLIPELPRLLYAAAIAVAIVIIQLARVVYVIRFTQSRQSMYGGAPRTVWGFFKAIGLDFFLGFGAKPGYAVPFAIGMAVLVVAGMALLKRRGVLAGLAILVPSLAATWRLSADNPVSTRYIVYLVPVLTCLAAAALARFRTVFVWAPLAFAIAVQSVMAVHACYDKPSDWGDAVKYVEKVREPGDIVAVFPAFWGETFKRFYPRRDFVPFQSPDEFDRIVATGRRIVLVLYPGRYAGHLAAYLQARTRMIAHFETKERFTLRVSVLTAQPFTPVEIAGGDDPSLVLGGLVSSGSYPWAAPPRGENPFARIAGIFGSADLAVTGYEPYRTTWRDGIVEATTPPIAPFADAISPLAAAGVGAVVMAPARGVSDDPTAQLRQAGLAVVPRQLDCAKALPTILTVRGEQIAFVNIGQHVFTDRPHLREPGDALIADWERAVSTAKKAVGREGRLVVFFPVAPDFATLLDPQDQLLARRAVDLGADVVVGLGGRATREIEEYKNGLIAYSLGTLLRPPGRADAYRCSTGVLLRLRFPPGEKAAYQLIPVTFDCEFRVAPTRPEKFADLRYRAPGDPAAEHLLDRLLYAKASAVNGGRKIEFTDWSAGPPSETFSHGEKIAAFLDKLHDWYFDYSSADEYPQEGWYRKKTSVAADGVTSLGVFRRAIRLHPGPAKKASIVFEHVTLGDRVHLVYGLGDDAVTDRFKPYPAETLTVTADGEQLLKQKVDYVVGWKHVTIDTENFRNREVDLAFAVEEMQTGTSFPIGVDPIVERFPETVADLAARAYRFDEHLAEAKAAVVDGRGARRCFGPDETFRYLRGGKHSFEEYGPFGEGILHRRWVCGPDLWDAVALTRQKSRGEIRDAIWMHPPKGGKRVLTYGPLRLRSSLKGFFGVTDAAARYGSKRGPQPVDFVILVDGREVLKKSATMRPGWWDFNVDIPEDLRGQDKEISFVTSTANAGWRHFCFNGSME